MNEQSNIAPVPPKGGVGLRRRVVHEAPAGMEQMKAEAPGAAILQGIVDRTRLLVTPRTSHSRAERVVKYDAPNQTESSPAFLDFYKKKVFIRLFIYFQNTIRD